MIIGNIGKAYGAPPLRSPQRVDPVPKVEGKTAGKVATHEEMALDDGQTYDASFSGVNREALTGTLVSVYA